MRTEYEIRTRPWKGLTHKSDGKPLGGDGRALGGHAAVFGVPTLIHDIGGDFEEVIEPGAFAQSLTEPTPFLMFNHGKHPSIGDMPLGRVS